MTDIGYKSFKLVTVYQSGLHMLVLVECICRC